MTDFCLKILLLYKNHYENEGYGFLSFARKFGDNYGKKLMDTATKTGVDASNTASKRVVPKTAEATGDLIGKSKNKQKRMK